MFMSYVCKKPKMTFLWDTLLPTSNDRFLRNFYMAFVFILLLGGRRRRNVFTFSFWYLIWDLNSALTSNKPIPYLLDYSKLGRIKHRLYSKIGIPHGANRLLGVFFLKQAKKRKFQLKDYLLVRNHGFHFIDA